VTETSVVREAGGFVQCGYFTDKRGSSDADFRIFWCKNLGLFESYGVSARTREERVESVRKFFGQRGKINFSRFCMGVFYGRHLAAG